MIDDDEDLARLLEGVQGLRLLMRAPPAGGCVPNRRARLPASILPFLREAARVPLLSEVVAREAVTCGTVGIAHLFAAFAECICASSPRSRLGAGARM